MKNDIGRTMMMRPAIVAVGYNRPDGIKRLLDSLGKAHYDAEDIPLIVSIDESDRSDEVEAIVKNFQWNYGEKIIRRFSERQGLRKHIVQCGDYSEQYGAVIILEDDLVVAEDFYFYVCKAHEAYGEDERICGVALYSYNANVFTHYTFDPVPCDNDVFLGDMVVTWGQSWNTRQWRNFKKWYLEHEDKLPTINTAIPWDISSWTRSWGRYFASFMADQKLSYIYPYRARTTCYSDFGEHNKSTIPFTFVQVPLMHGIPKQYKFAPYEDLIHYDSFYERVLDDTMCIAGISGSEICMDINNMKTVTGGKRYVVTNSIIKGKKIASFGLTLRPASLNVVDNIPGDQINLYEIESELIRPWVGSRPNYYVSFRRMKYEFRDASWRILISYAPKEFSMRLRDYIQKVLKKKK